MLPSEKMTKMRHKLFNICMLVSLLAMLFLKLYIPANLPVGKIEWLSVH